VPIRPSSDHQPHPITRAELARRAGKARSTITELCTTLLAPCCLPGGRLDAAHPAMQKVAREVWRLDPESLLVAPGASRTSAPSTSGTTAPAPAPSDAPAPRAPKAVRRQTGELPLTQPLEVLLDMTLRELSQHFGSSQGMADWLDVRKTIAETQRLESRNERDAGRLIGREFVRKHVFGYLDGLSLRLVRDAPTNIAARIADGMSREERLEIAHDVVSGLIKDAKRQAIVRINQCRVGDNPPPVADWDEPGGSQSSEEEPDDEDTAPESPPRRTRRAPARARRVDPSP
jgi:hypothetical protein